MRSFLLAVQLLTRIPVRIRGEVHKREMVLSVTMFPLVGLLVGGAMGLVHYLASLVLPGTLPALLAVLAALLLTGGLHLDGLMDTADGVFGSHTREKALAIMKDSRAGAMGVMACVVVLGIKTAAISSLIGYKIYPVLLLTPVAARTAMMPAMRYPYARQGEGTGSPYAGQVGKEHIMFSVLLALAVSALIMRTEGVVLVMGAWLVSAVTTWWLAKRLGGMTGDTYGFINEVAEISFLLLALMV